MTAARQLGTPLCNDSGKNDRYQEKAKHVADKMRNKTDQAVSGLAIQNRKKDRVDKDSGKVPRNDPGRACGIVRCGKDYSPGNSHRPAAAKITAPAIATGQNEKRFMPFPTKNARNSISSPRTETI